MMTPYTPINGATLYSDNYVQSTFIPKSVIIAALEDKLLKNSHWKKVRHVSLPPNLLQRENPYRIEQTPLYEVVFQHQITGHYFIVTDLNAKKYRRGKILQRFSDKYTARIGEDGDLTIYSVVADIYDYPNLTKFLDGVKMRLRRHKLQLKGYFVLRDYDYVGLTHKIEKKPHYHFLICINRYDSIRFKKLFSKYKVRIKKMDSTGMAGYLKQKGIYAGYRQRCFLASQRFKS